MTTAAATHLDDPTDIASDYLLDPRGVQNLLQPTPQRPNYVAQIGAASVYALLLGAVVTLSFTTTPAPVEEQQAIELTTIPAEEPPPEDTLPPPEEEPLPDLLPPPPMMDPIAPVDEVKPTPKPVEKPKVEKKVEKPPQKPRNEAKPAAKPTTAAPRPTTNARSDAPAMRAPAAPPGATPSAIANHFHSCMQRAASSFDAPFPGRVSYHATFSATGTMTSYSISPSGKGPLDSIASRLGARCGSVPAPGTPVSLSGAISFTP